MMNETLMIQLTDAEARELDRLAGRMGQDRDELIQEIISRALDTLRMMEDAGI
ncbi:MAG: ribbon-helix-helix protein, CopG family [Syntrophales bacterium]|nr:ribbon-helix-helix protein, CopG family [Syntrophales bacterium]